MPDTTLLKFSSWEWKFLSGLVEAVESIYYLLFTRQPRHAQKQATPSSVTLFLMISGIQNIFLEAGHCTLGDNEVYFIQTPLSSSFFAWTSSMQFSGHLQAYFALRGQRKDDNYLLFNSIFIIFITFLFISIRYLIWITLFNICTPPFKCISPVMSRHISTAIC